MRGGKVNRRELIGSVAAGASATFVCAPAIAQGAAHVIIIGGGFAGATCARQLKRFDPKIQVTLVETNPTFHSQHLQQGGSCRLPRVQCSAIHL